MKVQGIFPEKSSVMCDSTSIQRHPPGAQRKAFSPEIWLSQRKSVLACPLVANGSIAKGEAWDQDEGNKVFFVLILHSLYFLCNFYLLLAALGLCGCAGFSLVEASRGYTPVAVEQASQRAGKALG